MNQPEINTRIMVEGGFDGSRVEVVLYATAEGEGEVCIGGFDTVAQAEECAESITMDDIRMTHCQCPDMSMVPPEQQFSCQYCEPESV